MAHFGRDREKVAAVAVGSGKRRVVGSIERGWGDIQSAKHEREGGFGRTVLVSSEDRDRSKQKFTKLQTLSRLKSHWNGYFFHFDFGFWSKRVSRV
mgnify:CR=1 FL=1